MSDETSKPESNKPQPTQEHAAEQVMVEEDAILINEIPLLSVNGK